MKVSFIHTHVNPSIQPSVNTSNQPLTHALIYPSVHLSIHTSIYPSTSGNIIAQTLKGCFSGIAHLICLYLHPWAMQTLHILPHFLLPASRPPASSVYSPHYNSHQPHDSFIQAVKEVSEWPPLFPHAADDQTEADGEDHHAQGVHPVHRPRHWDQLLVSQLLAPI